MLTPCMQCRRHIAEERCPFCGGVSGPRREVVPPTGRLSRAAVLFGALALPGCSGTEPSTPARMTTVAATPGEAAVAPSSDAAAPTDAPTPPADAPSPPADAPSPPSDAAVGTKAAVGKGTLVVVAHRVDSKQPVPRYAIQIGRANDFARGAVTDAKGRAYFADLEPGEYTVYWVMDSGNRRVAPARMHKPVTVTAGAKVEIDVPVRNFQETPLITPYGAPSVRRRLV